MRKQCEPIRVGASVRVARCAVTPFAQDVVVADDDPGVGFAEGDVLRRAADHGMRVDLIACAEPRLAQDHRVRADAALIADLGRVFDDGIRADDDALSESGARSDDRRRMNGGRSHGRDRA